MAQTPDRVLPTALGTTAAAVLTAGGAGTWIIVRQIAVVNVSAQLVKVTVGVHTSASDAVGRRIASEVEVDARQAMPLLPADTIYTLKGHASTPDLIYAFVDAGNANNANLFIPTITGP